MLPVSTMSQCRLLSISWSSFCYAQQPEPEETLALIWMIDTSFLDIS